MFGSALRDDLSNHSDVDFLASLRPDVPLWTAPFYIGRDLLGVPDSGDRTNRWFLVAPGAAIGPTHLTWSLSRAGAATGG